MKYKTILWFFIIFLLVNNSLAVTNDPELNNPFDSDFLDISGNNNDGTATNAIISNISVIGNGSVYFDGTGDKVSYGNDMFEYNSGGVSMWVNTTQVNSIIYFNGRLKIGVGNIEACHTGNAGANGELMAVLYDGAGWRCVSTTGTTINDGNFYHVVYTWDGTNSYLYLNGTLEDSLITGTPAYLSEDATLGIDGSNPDYNGYVDQFKIYNHNLTSTDVNSLYLEYLTENNLTITAKNSLTGSIINIFNASINGITYNTTTGRIKTNILANSTNLYNITVSKTYYNTINYPNYNVSLSGNILASLTQTALNISVYYEENQSLINDRNLTITVIGDYFSQENQTTDGTLQYNADVLPNNDLLIQVEDDDEVYDDSKNHIITISGVNNIKLYMLPIADTSSVCFSITTPTGSAYPAYVKILRHYPETNEYKVVQVGKNDGTGEARFNVIADSQIYKYQIYSDLNESPTYTSVAQYLQATSCYTHRISDTTNPTEGWNDLGYISYNFYYNNATNTTVFSWSDDDNLVTKACLKTYKIGVYNTQINYTCTESATGSIYHNIPQVNGNYISEGYITTTSDGEEYFIGSFEKIINFEIASILGQAGIFLTMFIIIVLAFAGGYSGGVGIIFVSVGLLLLSTMKIILLPLTITIGIIGVGIIIMFLNKD